MDHLGTRRTQPRAALVLPVHHGAHGIAPGEELDRGAEPVFPGGAGDENRWLGHDGPPVLIRARLPRARGSRGHGMGVVEEFVDRPLVVGVLSVLERSDPPVRGDQEIRRQPEAASGGL